MSNVYYWTYFDIETLGLNPENDKIITIQYQNLVYDEDGKPMHNQEISKDRPAPGLHILKEWESDEKTILKQTYDDLLNGERRKYFEPVGNNLSFEGRFLKARLRKYGILRKKEPLRFGQLNQIDLMPVMKLINGGDSRTAKFFGKVGENQRIPDYYTKKEYRKIEQYVIEETQSFVKTMDYLMWKLRQFKNEILALHN
jgi:hypothetical protein